MRPLLDANAGSGGGALKLVRAWDRWAIERVFRESSSRRHAICWTLLRSEPLAEDVLQDVFIKIWCPDGSFDSSRGYPKTN